MARLNDINPKERFDLVIIGSGISGLCAAKTYLQVNPNTRIVVYEAEQGLGGVWALDRLYPNLQTNNLFGFYELSDFLASEADLTTPPDGSHIPGKDVNKYLTAYAEHFNLYPCLRFRHRVTTAEHLGCDGWGLTVEATRSDGAHTISSVFTSKLIVASGLCSRAQVPSFDHIGGAEFGAPIFHGKEMASRPETFAECRNVVVYGGTKMAWDAAYAYALAGAKVHWVIRSSGHGPCWMAPGKVTPFKWKVEQLVMTRILTWFSPCIWACSTLKVEKLCRWFLQQTWLGQRLVKGLFGAIQADVCAANRFGRSENTAKLKPWVDLFWIAGGQGVLGYNRNIFEMVAEGKIEVHIDEVIRLSNKTVHLKETTVAADALVCCTGWAYEPSVKFLPEGIDKDLGLPYRQAGSPEEAIQRADEKILNDLPILRQQPAAPPKTKAFDSQDNVDLIRPNQPYRLYRFMAPASEAFHDRNIAFVGFQINFGVPLTVQAQSLWIAAYFAGKLPIQQLPNQLEETEADKLLPRTKAANDQISKDTMLHTQFCRWRFPWGFGSRFPDFVFELVPYLDMVLADLGLHSDRKMQQSQRIHRHSWLEILTGGLWSIVLGACRETFEPYDKHDYIGLTEEWVAANREV